jgi:hypothetical protein
VPASKMLVRGETESEELKSEAITENVAAEEGRVPARLVVWIPAHRDGTDVVFCLVLDYSCLTGDVLY